MVFIVMEIQSDNTTAAHLVDKYDNRNAAESKFHTILAAAAISQIPTHTAVMLTDTGKALKSETYTHEVVESEVEE